MPWADRDVGVGGVLDREAAAIGTALRSHGRLETPPTSAWAWNSWSSVCLHAGALGQGAGRGDGDGDGQAAVVAGAGGGGAAVDRGDGRDDGQAESEAVVGGAVVEPLERLEDAVGVRAG